MPTPKTIDQLSNAPSLAADTLIPVLRNGQTVAENATLAQVEAEMAPDFATAAQGAKADTALQPSDINQTVQGLNEGSPVNAVHAAGTIQVNSDGTPLGTATGSVTVGSGGMPYFSVDVAVHGATFDFTAQNFVQKAGSFSADGTKLFSVDGGNGTIIVYRYDLSTPYDVSTAVFVNSLDVKALFSLVNSAQSQGVQFNADGSLMFVMGTSGDFSYSNPNSVWSVSLGTPYDLTTASAVDRLDIGTSSGMGNPYGFFFKPDGTKFYVTDDAAPGQIYTFSLSSAFVLASASFSSLSAHGFTGGLIPTGLAFSPDGMNVILSYDVNGIQSRVTATSLSSAWDLTSFGSSVTNNLASVAFDTESIVFNGDGTSFVTSSWSGLGGGLFHTWNIPTDVNVQDGDTFAVGTETYTFKNTPVGTFDVQVGANPSDSAVNLGASITSHSTEVSSVVSSNVVSLTALSSGSGGNYALSQTGGRMVLSGASMTGGSDEVGAIAAGDSITVGTATGVAGTDFAIDTNKDTALNNALTFLGGAQSDAFFGSSSGGIASVTATTAGISGNSIGMSTTSGNVTLSDSHLDGGVNGTVGKAGELVSDSNYIYACTADNTVTDANWKRIPSTLVTY